MNLRQEIDIEQLVTWALRDQGLGWDAPGSGTMLGSMAALGTMVSGGMIADPSVGLLSDEDAIIVRRTIDGLPGKARTLVVQHGRSGTRPDGAAEPMPEPQQKRNNRGQLMWDYANPKDRNSSKTPVYDHFACSQERKLVEFARATWTLWREGLVALIGPLNEQMRHHTATGPRAPAEPWSGEAPKVHGMGNVEPSEKPQPWLDTVVSVEDRSLTVDDLVADANAEVRAVASDWGDPSKPIYRRRRGGRRVKKSVLESASGEAPHGGS